MIAEVIPYTRSIRGKDVFDYQIPAKMSLSPGSLVRIPFRSQSIPGVVWKIKKESEAKQLKTIQSLYPQQYWNTPERLQFLEWFAQYYYISLPHALKTLQYPLVSFPRKKLPLSCYRTNNLPVSSVSPAAKELFQRIIPHEQHVLVYNHREDILRVYRELIDTQPSHTLIIVPEYRMVSEIASTVNGSVIQWSKDPSPSDISILYEMLRAGDERYTVIGTKKMISLDSALFSLILVDQEESRSHKQYHLNPRYHVPTVVQALHGFFPTASAPTVLYSSHAPSLAVFSRTSMEKSKIHFLSARRPWNAQHIRVVNMEEEQRKQNYSWFSEDLVTSIHNSRRSFVFLNRTGEYRVALCKDCSSLIPPTSLRCEQCGGSSFQLRQKGVERLEKELITLFPKKRILRIDRTQEDVPDDLFASQPDIVIGTEKVFRVFPLQYFDCIGILSVDHLLLYPHFQSHERVFQLLTFLFIQRIPTILQTHAPHHTVIRFAVENAYEPYAQQELSMRKLLSLPPFRDFFSLIDTRTKKVTTTHTIDSTTLPPHVLVDRL